ncbi:hypothetical protein [Salmonella phage PKM.Hi.22.6]|uniref:Uncharacterized protein n=1 Tax=phage PKM.Lu.22.1 TaxID=3049197 RepID=A0AAF0KYT5_9CAUD|nr:hypothetical protein [phage PKM.Lu.22.1]WKV17143.1 hypothetical protein [Salmonella phage PKM.Hi.22.6]
MSNVILLATDPELFTRDSSTGAISSVSGLLGADKYNKKAVTEDVRIQEDNVLVEFDTNPHGEFESFDKNIVDGIKYCEEAVGYVGHELAMNVSSHIYTAAELERFHKDAFVFGCEPDYNALTGMRNPKPQAADPGLRTAGGHIHVGYDTVTTVTSESQKVLGVMCDYFLGLPALLLDGDDRRKELYGKAGACRFKPYGIEYRVMSNFWIMNKENRKWAWEQAQKAFAMMRGDFRGIASIINPEEVQRVINNNDKALAKEYVRVMEIC